MKMTNNENNIKNNKSINLEDNKFYKICRMIVYFIIGCIAVYFAFTVLFIILMLIWGILSYSAYYFFPHVF